MDIRLADPIYTDRLASFLESLGQTAIPCGPGQIDVIVSEQEPEREVALREMEIYLRVWRVLYPDAEIEAVEHDHAPVSRDQLLAPNTAA
jgi:hypothetical protein